MLRRAKERRWEQADGEVGSGGKAGKRVGKKRSFEEALWGVFGGEGVLCVVSGSRALGRV